LPLAALLINNKIISLLAQEPFDPERCKVALANLAGSGYRAAVNFWSFDVLFLPTTEVPIQPTAVKSLAQHHFAKPAVFPVDLVVGVTSTDEALDGITKKSLRLASPPELVFAYISAIGRDLKKDDDELLAAWRQTMLCVPCLFKIVVSDDDRHLMMVQFREDLSQNYATMRFSAVQKMFDVKSVMDRKAGSTGGVTVSDVAKYYQDGVRFAEGSDVITAEFVDCAMTVLRRLMATPRCSELIMSMEELGAQSPLDSIYKLQKIVSRAQSPTKIEWCLELMIDFWRSGALASDQLSIRHIDGKAKGAGGKGVIDILMFKQECLSYLLGELMGSRPLFTSDAKQNLRGICRSIQHFRSKCGYVYNGKYRKAACRANWGLLLPLAVKGAPPS